MNDEQEQSILKRLLQNKMGLKALRDMFNGYSDVTKYLLDAEMSILMAMDNVKRVNQDEEKNAEVSKPPQKCIAKD